jgi:hypothetical protein
VHHHLRSCTKKLSLPPALLVHFRQRISPNLYIKRNLAHIEQLIDSGATLEALNKKQYKTLLVLTEVYRQQLWLFENNKQSIEDRIVSLIQPHIRPIVRGKAGKSVEFGAKISASCFEGYVFLDRMSWDNFNESLYLKAQVEAYYKFTWYSYCNYFFSHEPCYVVAPGFLCVFLFIWKKNICFSVKDNLQL